MPRKGAPVSAYDLTGKFVKTYATRREAYETLGLARTAIHRAANKYDNTSGGFFWRDYECDQITDFKVPRAGRPPWRPLSQYTLEGKYIKTFTSTREASLETGVGTNHLKECACREEDLRPAGGFLWYYDALEQLPEHLMPKPPVIKNPIKQYDLDGNLLGVFVSLRAAGKAGGVTPTAILNATRSKTHICNGYVWIREITAEEKK